MKQVLIGLVFLAIGLLICTTVINTGLKTFGALIFLSGLGIFLFGCAGIFYDKRNRIKKTGG